MGHRPELRLGGLTLCAGGAALVAQTVIVRELMVSFYGTETAIAAALCAWLAFVATGAGLGALCVQRRRRPHSLCLGTAVWLAAALWPAWLTARLVRCILGAGVGAFMPPGAMVVGAVLACLPAGLAVGFFLPCAAGVAELRRRRPGAGVGLVYVCEAVGSALMGALLSLVLLGLLCPAVITGLASGALLVAAGLLGTRPGRCRLALVCAGAVVMGLAGLLGPRLDAVSALWRWRSVSTFARLDSLSTRYQYVELGGLAGERVLVRNGRVSEQFPDEPAMRELAALVLTQHPAPRSLLLVGGGLTGLCQAFLRAPIERLDYAEPDPAAMRFTLNSLAPAARSALQDKRFTAFSRDGRALLRSGVAGPPDYDIICLNIGDPTSAADSRFYTVECFRQAALRLRPGGVLAVVGITGSANYLERGLAQDYVACLYASLRAVFPHVAVSPGERLCFFAASSSGVVTTAADIIGNRFGRLGLEPAIMRFALAIGAFPEERVAATEAALAGRGPAVPPNSDRRPVLFSRFLALEAAYAQGSGPARFTAESAGGGSVLWWVVLAAAAAALPLWLALTRARRGADAAGPRAAGVVVLTTGAFGLAAELLVIYGYQVTFGFVYRDIALLTGLFMLGLAGGAAGATRAGPSRPRRALIPAEAAQAAFALALPLLAGADWASPALYAAASFASGALTGLVFPLAAFATVRAGVPGAAAAGWLSAADHGGALLGAASAGLFLLPAAGLQVTAVLIAAAKLVSLAGLLAAGRPEPREAACGPELDDRPSAV